MFALCGLSNNRMIPSRPYGDLLFGDEPYPTGREAAEVPHPRQVLLLSTPTSTPFVGSAADAGTSAAATLDSRSSMGAGFMGHWVEVVTHDAHGNVRVLTERSGTRDDAVSALCDVVKDHLVGADILSRIGYPRAAALVRETLPTVIRTQSGDLGEIIATVYIEEYTEFGVPLKRLRHKDDRDMPMRGDDVIGLHRTNGKPVVLKAEVKSREALAAAVVGEACTSLDAHRGRPKPATLAFIATQLRRTSRDTEAERIEDLMTTRIGARDITHLVFTLSGNDPAPYLTAHAENRHWIADRRFVGLRVLDHQSFIRQIFNRLHEQTLENAPVA